ncbi:winged helix DNA-binding protein [Sphingomonas sp.]|uniref:winged helix DNA-binding protein n=1 Tax=Sphingomonas sp. TaxID=28214 RepID=UPI001DCEE9CC|nr:winged helix DNA-binding protein [Sphingomonas sp.]MBX9796735.1 winged helix DNA-binding protein [Sphingomonas sp.]
MTGWGAGPGAVALVAAPAGAAMGEQAIALAGAHLIAPAALSVPVAAPVLLIEAADLGDDVLLPLIAAAAAAAAGGTALVVAMAPAQIDLVAAALIETPAQLLCAAGLSERVAALTLARRAAPAPRLRETEAERLAALRDEIARLVETLSRLSADPGERPPVALADRTTAYRAGDAGAAPVTAADIRAVIKARRLRDALFGAGLFEDPAWDMLLDLHAAHLEGAQVSVSSLCIAAAVAPTTALRWIQRLTALGLLVRSPDPDDGRRAFLALSPAALAAMGRYWAAAPLR